MSGVRVHGYGIGAAVDFTAIDLNMEFLLALSVSFVGDLVL